MGKHVWSSSILALLILLGLTLSTLALGQAFGRTNIADIRGLRALMLVPNPPDGLQWTAGPVAICNASPCTISQGAEFTETGWIKGVQHGLNNQTRQYVTWQGTDGVFRSDYFIGGALANNLWYQLRVMYSVSAGRWEAWRGNNIPWYEYGLGWTKGVQAAIGAEANSDGNWMNAIVSSPEYKVGSGSWTLFNYGYEQTTDHGCVDRLFTYGHKGYDC